MNYDFTTVPGHAESAKYIEMTEANPSLPPDIVPLSVADMEFKTAPEITAGLSEYLEDLVFGYAVPGPAYYDAVCHWMKKRHNWTIEKEWILTSNGVVSALFNAVGTLAEAGDTVILMPPVYHPFYRVLKHNRLNAAENELVIRNGRYEIDFDDLEQKAKDPKAKALLFCSPHNPVGRVWKKEELEKVGRICLENNVTIISDEIHFDLIMPGHVHRVFAALDDAFADNMIVCTAPSKSFNLAGLHGSNIIIKNKQLRNRYLETLSRRTSYPGLTVFAYKACEIAYTRCEKWLAELLVIIERNKTFAEDFLNEHIPAIKVFPLEGSYLQWWDCRGLGMDHAELERFMKNEALLFLNEGYIFGSCGRGFERINLACPPQVLEAALKRLDAALQKRERQRED